MMLNQYKTAENKQSLFEIKKKIKQKKENVSFVSCLICQFSL